MRNVSIMLLGILLFGCDKEGDNPVDSGGNLLSVSVRSLQLLITAQAEVTISGGTLPYTVMSQSDPSVASASMSDRTVLITAGSVGTATIKVKDASSSPKTATITVTVVTSYQANAAGTLSFSSNRGNFAAAGIADIGINAPASGSGVVALKDYDGLLIIAYTVNSPVSYDLTTALFLDSKPIAAGTYTYPTAVDHQVQISYAPGINPADTTGRATGYILAVSATSTIDTLNGSFMSGSFSGNGYFIERDTARINETITLTGGTFRCPVITIGSAEQVFSRNPVIRNAQRFLKRQ